MQKQQQIEKFKFEAERTVFIPNMPSFGVFVFFISLFLFPQQKVFWCLKIRQFNP